MSKRLEILDAAKTLLSEITDFDNRVYKKITMPRLIKEYPVINVILGDANYEALSASAYYKVNPLELVVIIWDKVTKDTDNEGLLTDALEDLTQKVVHKLSGSVNLGLNYVELIAIKTISPYVDWENKIGAIELTFWIVYGTEETNI